MWFSLSVGRRDRADPKWLIPLICRAGPVRKADIGAIRIGDSETMFEIRPTRAREFADAIAAREPDEVRIAPLEAGAQPHPAVTRRRSPTPRG